MNEALIENHNKKLKDLIYKKRLWNSFLTIIIIVGVILSSKIIDINSSRLLDGIPRLGDYVSQILPSLDSPSLLLDSKTEGSIAYWYFNLPKYLKLLFETFNMALLATLIGSSLALLLSFLAAKNTAPNSFIYFTTRRILEFFRGVPEIIFAILFVWALGIGPIAGIIAMTLHTTGSLGKLFSEVHENSDIRPREALKASGGNWLSEMKFGLLPQVLPNLISYILLRFEINIRASTILGFVGAGGIGQELYLVINFNYYEEVSAIILLIIFTVISIDLLSGYLRKNVIEADSDR
jgi:phosphonate transport system permease protein